MLEPSSDTDPFVHWCALRDKLLETNTDIARGKMMSADALTYKGKVFAFFSTKGGRVGLGCRVGRRIDPGRFDLTDWQALAPFKSKPPMKDWIVVGTSDASRWAAVASHCLTEFRSREHEK